jgi:hypothetical protein
MEANVSAAFEVIRRPDWAATTIVPITDDASSDPRNWAVEIFGRSSPLWIKALFGLRQVAATVLRLPKADPAMLAVDRVVGDEAVIDTDDVHLHFAAGVRADPRAGLLYVTTAVAFKGWRGRVYFVPVRLLHDAITRSMMNRAVHRI